VRALGSQEIVAVWEAAMPQHPIDRALTLLCASVGRDRAELAELSLGERDELLFELRERLFGAALEAYVECPECGEQLEFSTTTTSLRARPAGDAARELVSGEYALEFRLLNSRDLGAIVEAGEPEAARAVLLERCVLAARRAGEPLAPRELPPEIVDELGERIEAADPQAAVRVTLPCPACGAQCRVPFSIAAFLWSEVNAQARRLLHEAADLARAFGWRDVDTLAMSPARRRFYLELARA